MTTTSFVQASDQPDLDYIAELLSNADRTHTPFLDILRINPILSERALYGIQKRFVALKRKQGATIAGYKGGFVPQAPIGGVLFKFGLLTGSPTIDRSNFQNLLVEAEIGFRLCHARLLPFKNIEELKQATCGVFPAIELPDAAFSNLGELRKDFSHLRRLLIPTNMASSHLLIGNSVSPLGIDLDRLDVRVTHNDTQLGFRDGRKSSDDIWLRVLWTVNRFVLQHGYRLEPEHIIIPGALTGLHPGKPGHYHIDYGSLGTVEFDVK